MTEEEDPTEEIEQKPPPIPRRPFNPMVTYIYVAIGIFVTYGTLYIFGYIAVIILMLALMFRILHETRYILANYTYTWVRRAAYFNALHAFAYFSILVINGFALAQGDVPLILPQIERLTWLSPLFVLLGIFGTTNIRKMYIPSTSLPPTTQ
ncbi:MAG: hypothetical protein ACFE7R_09560 [Candidatus Hodarchaeota archaeon]